MVALLACVLGLAQSVVCLDPGHISEFGSGAKGKHSTELQVAWEVANTLADRLRARGITVVMAKTKVSQKVSNADRARVANQAKADLWLRLHCDAAKTRGFAVFYPDRAGEAYGRTGPSPEIVARSKAMAETFQSTMTASLAKTFPSRGLKTDRDTKIGAEQGALTGSIFSEVPTILVEMVVITNPTDEAFILSKVGRTQMIDALVAATLAALKVKP